MLPIVGKDVDGGLAALPHSVREIRAFRRVVTLEGGHLNAVLFREPCRSGRRLDHLHDPRGAGALLLLANAGFFAHPSAQVVELRAANVADRHHLETLFTFRLAALSVLVRVRLQYGVSRRGVL